MNHKTVEIVAGTLFGLVALFHLLRLIFNVPIMIGEMQIPLLASVVPLVVSGILSYLLLKNAMKK